MKFFEAAVFLLGLLTLDSGARAQSQTQTGPEQVESAAAAEPVIPVPSLRHGFYLRVNSNTGYATITGDGPQGHATISGLGTGVLVAAGGTLTRGFVLAGTLQATNLMAKFNRGPFEQVSLTLADRTLSASRKVDAVIAQAGLLVDWYPDPSLAWHAGATGGLGILSLVNRADESTYYGSGVGGTFFGGYDWPMSKGWCMGIALFASASTTARMKESDRGSDTGYRLHSFSIGVAGSLLYF